MELVAADGVPEHGHGHVEHGQHGPASSVHGDCQALQPLTS